jgi:hypothetical protein
MLINPASSFNRPMMGGPGSGNQGGMAPQLPQTPSAPVQGPGGVMVQNMTPNAGPPRMGQQAIPQAATPGTRATALTGYGAGGSMIPGGGGSAMNPFNAPNPSQFGGPGGTNSLGATMNQQRIGMFNNPNAAMPNQTPQARMSAMVQALRNRAG